MLASQARSPIRFSLLFFGGEGGKGIGGGPMGVERLPSVLISFWVWEFGVECLPSVAVTIMFIIFGSSNLSLLKH